jgi:alpha-glucosidase (family GH31 glycosyl hydrolase)
MLDFQTRFTVAEGNVGLPYVSHDIGGFQGDRLSDELYVRWVQSGAFQPILRLHSSRTGDVRRLPWEYAGKARSVSAEFLRLRAALVPYLYSVARESHDSGLPMARGMYLTWPAHDEAYEHDRQYMLGPQLLVAPVAAPGDPAVKRVWFPPGRWVDIFTGQRHAGPAVETLRVGLERMPVFARAGGIVPRQPYADASTPAPPRVLELDVFAGRSGAFSLYEDAGDGFAYRGGGFARTALRWNQRRRTLTIGGSRGRYGGQPRRRTYRVRFVGVNRPRRVRGAARWAYDASTRTLTARTRSVRATDRLRVVLVA